MWFFTRKLKHADGTILLYLLLWTFKRTHTHITNQQQKKQFLEVTNLQIFGSLCWPKKKERNKLNLIDTQYKLKVHSSSRQNSFWSRALLTNQNISKSCRNRSQSSSLSSRFVTRNRYRKNWNLLIGIISNQKAAIKVRNLFLKCCKNSKKEKEKKIAQLKFTFETIAQDYKILLYIKQIFMNKIDWVTYVVTRCISWKIFILIADILWPNANH